MGGQPVWVAFWNPVRCLDVHVNCQVQKSVKAKLLQKVPQTAGGIDAAGVIDFHQSHLHWKTGEVLDAVRRLGQNLRHLAQSPAVTL